MVQEAVVSLESRSTGESMSGGSSAGARAEEVEGAREWILRAKSTAVSIYSSFYPSIFNTSEMDDPRTPLDLG